MGNSDANELEQRRLRPDDAPRLVALSYEAGWNQTDADWRLMLERGEGFGYWCGDAPVASTLILPYGNFAWLSMVLVAMPWRRKGLASRLTEFCLARARALGMAVWLDATDAGRVVYRQFGFTDQYTFTRFAADRPHIFDANTTSARIVTDDDMDTVVTFDAAAFGADRGAVLAHLRRRCPGHALVSEASGAMTGLVLARDGCRALHVGPLVARDPATATALAAVALRNVREPVFIDAVDEPSVFLSWLSNAGFTPQRQFTRMSVDAPATGPAATSFAVAGPEFG